MEKLTPFIMCVIFLAVAFCFWRLALKISSYAARRKILSYGKASEESTSVLLISYFGELAVHTNVWLPLKTKNATIYTEIDDIVILLTCIAVIEVKSMTGQIFNGDSRTWHQSTRLRSGERRELDFENPIIQNERHIIALTKILENEKIDIPPIYNIVIFSSNKVVFSEDSPEVYSLSNAINKMKELSNGKKLSHKEKLKISRAIKKYSTNPVKARAHNAKVRKLPK
ncbi:MAG: nuclease-related domain-containing protein [Eubacteriales bacterium]